MALKSVEKLYKHIFNTNIIILWEFYWYFKRGLVTFFYVYE